MEMLADLWQVAHRLEEPRAGMAGMRAREADALHAGNLVDGREKIREVARRIVGRLVVIDDLAEQLHLAPAGIGRLPYVRQDVGLCAHPFVPARVRHDAERAVVVAPFDDRDVRLDGIGAPRDPERERHVVPRIDLDLGERRARSFFDEGRQHLQPLRPHDDVDDMAIRFLQEGVAFLLCDAAGHGHDRRAPGFLFEDPQLAESRIELLLGVLAHAARVDDDEVGFDLLRRCLVAGLVEQTRHPLRVVEVHLAAEGLDQVSLRHWVRNS
jgi:hypothetical protein